MPRGSLPGERRGGRKKGVPNKVNIERAVQVATDVGKASAAGKLPKETLLEVMRYFRGMAAKHQPGGPEENESKFIKYLELAGDFASKAAPYYHPRLTTVTVKDGGYDLSRLTDQQLAEFERLARVAAVAGRDSGGAEATRH